MFLFQSLEINKQLNKAANKNDFDINFTDDNENKIDTLMRILIALVDERDKMLQDLGMLCLSISISIRYWF